MLNVHEMIIFLAAAETENFSEAARRLNMTQPAVSMAIRSLEKRLKVRLFERAGRNVRLSDAGMALMPMARDLVHMSQHLEETISAHSSEIIGHLKIGCSTTAGKYVLPPLIARFRDLHPQVRVTVITDCGRAHVLELLCDGHTHISVVSSLGPCPDAEFQHFFTDQVVLIVPRDHRWAERDAIRAEELTEETFILRTEFSGTRQVMEEGLLEQGVHLGDLNVVMELGNAEAIEMAVEQGIGVAFVSGLVAQRGVELGRIHVVPVEGLRLERPIYMAQNSRRPPTRAQAAFWKFVRQPANGALLKALVSV